MEKCSRILHKVTLNKKLLFAVDGVGALLSAFTLGIVLPIFQTWIGLPFPILFSLSLLALSYAIYSLVNAFGIIHYRPLWLKITIFGNIFYCATAGVLLGTFANQITALGAAYFLGELVIILGLAVVEMMALRQPYSSTGE